MMRNLCFRFAALSAGMVFLLVFTEVYAQRPTPNTTSGPSSNSQSYRLDFNGDGKVAKDDYSTYIATINAAINANSFDNVREILDVNCNGGLYEDNYYASGDWYTAIQLFRENQEIPSCSDFHYPANIVANPWRGDVNKNGTTADQQDREYIQQQISNNAFHISADMNCDGQINNDDLSSFDQIADAVDANDMTGQYKLDCIMITTKVGNKYNTPQDVSSIGPIKIDNGPDDPVCEPGQVLVDGECIEPPQGQGIVPLCSGYESEGLFKVGGLCPSSAQKVFHFAADGNDNNPGTVEQPMKSYAKAISVADDRLAQETWLLFKRGEEFDAGRNSFGNFTRGKDGDEPLVLSSYGAVEGSDARRPLIKVQSGIMSISGGGSHDSGQHIMVAGLHFKGYGTPIVAGHSEHVSNEEGIRINNCDIENVLIEDNYFQNIGKKGLVFQCQNAKSEPPKFNNIQVLNNVFDKVGRYSGASNPACLFMAGVDNVVIEGNVYHNCGNGPGVSDYEMDKNHHNYLQKTMGAKVMFRSNIMANTASHGVQMRTGGDMINNLSLRNAIGLQSSAGYMQQNKIMDNVIMDSLGTYNNGVNSSTKITWGMILLTKYDAIVKNNIIANPNPSAQGNFDPLRLTLRNDNYDNFNQNWHPLRGGQTNRTKAVIEDNLISGWGDNDLGFTRINNSVRSNIRFDDVVARNNIVGTISTKRLSSQDIDDLNMDQILLNNTYLDDVRHNFPNPDVQAYHYMADVLGMSASHDTLMAYLRTKSTRLNYDPRMEAGAINNYVRAAFGKSDVAVPAVNLGGFE